ncbi:RepB family plasmid replication initiator protein [Francisella philomiragia]|uniref:replication initiation protein n=1 Tax=Francisella philomiragia TaxID=28110 RepID=UPI0019067777|nr:replication initiation protein [Francisella philomiragia]MBK2026538.1 replication initiation protein [Francisella philomiragia]
MSKSDIVEKTFYLTSLFSKIKTDHSWTTNEVKVVLLIFKELSKYRIYIPDFEKEDDGYNLLVKEIDKVPLNYTFSKKDFQNITSVKTPHLSREIKKVIKGLLGKVIIMPSPIEKHNTESIRAVSWFSKIDYLDTKGTIHIEINKYAIEKLVAFINYSKINFESVVGINNNHAIQSYIFFKLLLDCHKMKSIVITIDEFKEQLGLQNKYKITKTFADKVLDVIYNEINKTDDLTLKYDLIREGKGYAKIKFDFDYKNKPLITNQNNNSNESDNLFGFDTFNINGESYFEAILTSWGIRAKTVVEIEESCSLDVINAAIEVTKQAIEDKIIENSTPAGFFIETLKNKKLQSQVEFERQQLLIREQQEKERKAALLEEYKAIEKFINDNSNEISNYLSIRSGGGLFELSAHVKEELEKLAFVDIEKFKDFRSKFVVLEQGFWDMKQRKEIRPTMYQFLKLINFYLAV